MEKFEVENGVLKSYKIMKEIELLEKLVEIQEMYIEKMNDYDNLKISYEAFKEVKIGKINNLQNEIEQQKIEYASLIELNDGLTQQIAELKQQYEELQNSLITVEDNNQ